MKREIKFRTWYRGNMTYAHSFNINIGGQVYYLDTTGEWEQDENNQVILMQFTGLRDKNGVEIYEGDIVQVTNKGALNGTRVVIYDHTTLSFALMPTAGYTKEYHGIYARCTCIKVSSGLSCLLIGNIYQNPELLNGEEAGKV